MTAMIITIVTSIATGAQIQPAHCAAHDIDPNDHATKADTANLQHAAMEREVAELWGDDWREFIAVKTHAVTA